MKDFIKRNRIISGIADATLVVECRSKSGTTSTARFTIKQNKKVYCIPHSLDSSIGIGINELITKGAIPVTSPKQIINDLYNKKKEEIYYKDIKAIYENYVKKNNDIERKYNLSNIPIEYRKIYEELIDKELTNNELCRILDDNISDLNYKLTMMEIKGYIIKNSENKFLLKG